ncbi:hypothetical protein ACIU1J_05480 [Azospirillum doebereinerae]|uniref:hypothetical protein n=1 Tax=Azospirillum doebereinerae TaxID=92933 RepID=UPI001EE5D4B4|nr:hypothetical protein [Azospirillum doebereinerae]MCG5240867.1 hypothetical protein [Azospirillum doebereinerae]
MQQPDTTLPATRDSAAPAKKTRRLSKKLIAAIDALADGKAKTQTEAAALVGIARETLTRALQRPDVQEELRVRVERQIKGKTLVRAAGKLDRLIDAQSENVAFRATELALGLNGFQPPQRGAVVNASVNVGWVVDLRSDETKPGVMQGCTIIDVESVEGDHGQ